MEYKSTLTEEEFQHLYPHPKYSRTEKTLLLNAAQKAHNIENLQEKEKIFNDYLKTHNILSEFYFNEKLNMWKPKFN